ncbi:MAG: HAD family hydrolase [Clostridia bacterium]|nr:HAD family hydrolase [Clostridia bacterium]
MVKAVLFDLDGTLINSIDDLADSVNHTLGVLGYPTHETEKYKYFIGNGMRKLIERALGVREAEVVDRVLEKFMAYYREHSLDKTRPYDGVKELLSALTKKGIISVIVTNKAHAAAVKIGKHFFGDNIKVYGQREGVPTKPDPAIVNLVLDELRLHKSECIFVGDSGMDMAVGVNSGVTPVGVSWGFRTKDELWDNGASFIADTPAELLCIVEKLNG